MRTNALIQSAYPRLLPAATIARGTRITLHLKEDAEELLDPTKLSSLVKTYSEFISFPIEVWASSQESKQVEDAAATATAVADWEKDKAAAEAEGKEFKEAKPGPVRPALLCACARGGRPQRPERRFRSLLASQSLFRPVPLSPPPWCLVQIMKTEFATEWGWKVQNNNKPIWMRSPKEVDPKDYDEFYKVRRNGASLGDRCFTRRDKTQRIDTRFTPNRKCPPHLRSLTLSTAAALSLAPPLSFSRPLSRSSSTRWRTRTSASRATLSSAPSCTCRAWRRSTSRR